jgi:cytochrome c
MNRSLLALIVASIFCQFGCSDLSSHKVRAAYEITAGGNARAGRDDIRKYGCYTCHTIPGVAGANGLVGPPLTGIAVRQYLAGELPNTPENMMRWIQHPHQVEPHTVMPEMNVSEQDSRDIAAYLYTLRRQP